MRLEPNLSLYARCAAKPVTETLSIHSARNGFEWQTRRSEGMPQFLLTQFRLKQVFIILRVGVLYILIKRVGKLMTSHEKMWSVHIEQVCNTFHVQFGVETTLKWGKIQPLTSGGQGEVLWALRANINWMGFWTPYLGEECRALLVHSPEPHQWPSFVSVGPLQRQLTHLWVGSGKKNSWLGRNRSLKNKL